MRRSWCALLLSRSLPATALVCGLAAPAWSQVIDTGPQQQRLSWRAGGSTLNSVVQVHTRYASGANGFGTGTVIDKHVDGKGVGWLCVLTADHVVAPDAVAGNVTRVRVGFGDATGAFTADNAHGVFGGARAGPAANARVYRGKRSAAGGGLDGVDIAVVAIRYGAPDAFFGGIRKATLAPWTPGPAGTVLGGPLHQFTEVGYGGSGNFSAGGMDFVAADGKKRFQNNVLERVIAHRRGGYAYDAVQWDFNKAAAQARDPMGVPLPGIAQPLLASEGLSYRGDSGGPYFNYAAPFEMQHVGDFDRDGPADPTNWKAGDMRLLSDFLYVVHTLGNSLEPGKSRYTAGAVHTWGAGVPITPAYAAWIGGKCALIPTPGSLALVGVGGILAARRRR